MLKSNQLSRPAIALLMSLGLCSCRHEPIAHTSRTSADNVRQITPSELLGNMPVNSDRRCMGVCLVAEAILEGTFIDDSLCDEPEVLARQIYKCVFGRRTVRYRREICLNGDEKPIWDRESLDKLTRFVADLYEQQYDSLIATDAGQQRLVAGMKPIRTSAELQKFLQADEDHLDVFCAFGSREFPHGEEECYHAVLIGRDARGNTIIYDPNDPGVTIFCHTDESEEGLLLEWTCRYRDSGYDTSQVCQVIHKDVYFQKFTRP